MGVNKKKKSKDPTRAQRIERMEKTARRDDHAQGSSSAAAAAEPASAGEDEDDDDDDDESADEDEDDESMDLTAGIQQAIADSLSLQQPVDDESEEEASLSSSILDPLDSRHEILSNPDGVAELRQALQMTVDEFVLLTGQQPAPTNPGDNYFSQRGMLQEQMRTWWAGRGYAMEAPRLPVRGRWTGGVHRFGYGEILEGDDQEAGQEEEERG